MATRRSTKASAMPTSSPRSTSRPTTMTVIEARFLRCVIGVASASRTVPTTPPISRAFRPSLVNSFNLSISLFCPVDLFGVRYSSAQVMPAAVRSVLSLAYNCWWMLAVIFTPVALTRSTRGQTNVWPINRPSAILAASVASLYTARSAHA